MRYLKNNKYFSQAGQDLFVLEMLRHKKNGYYCEVGGNHPFESNNTFLLENDYSWKGVSIEYDAELTQNYNKERHNLCIQADATSFNYFNYFTQNNFPKQIDYLSLDIDPAENTYKALKQIPFEHFKFSVITYEHDKYSSGEKYMNLSREFILSLGYKMVVSNVKVFGRDFEDWYVDKDIVSNEIWNLFESKDIEFKDIFKSIK